VQVLNGGGPFPGPTSAPFWQPSTDGVQQPWSNCTSGAVGFGGSQFMASHFWGNAQVEVKAAVDVPPYLQPALGGSTSGMADTVLTFIHAATPGMILYCSMEVRNRVQGAITAAGSAPLPTPMPDGTDQASPPPDNNGHCN
jgi:hypothetical protein